MTLQPFFSVNPLQPIDHTYNPAQPNSPWAVGRFHSYGGTTKQYSPYRLTDQHNNNELILGYAPANSGNRTVSVPEDVYRFSAMKLVFYGENVRSDNQYLLLFSIRHLSGLTYAQFYVGNKLVRVEEVDGEEQVAIVMDVPGDGAIVYVLMRMESPSLYSAICFKGVTCYLL